MRRTSNGPEPHCVDVCCGQDSVLGSAQVGRLLVDERRVEHGHVVAEADQPVGLGALHDPRHAVVPAR